MMTISPSCVILCVILRPASSCVIYRGLGIHPNDNTATLHVPLADVVAMLDEHGTPHRFVALPGPEAEPSGE